MTSETDHARSTAVDIVHALHDVGYTAYFAGGCVRDQLLGHQPKDYDVATNATPDQVRSIFPRARLVGAKFGVVVVSKGNCQTEVATFRTDGTYSDGRRPDQVAFCSELDDARRRDFTINGLFFDPLDERVIDHVGGQEDLRSGILRTIGDPDQRFSEDHLRMLRGVRLSARLAFQLEKHTAEAIRRLGSHLGAISPERIWMELEQILRHPSRGVGWRLLMELGLHDDLSPALQFGVDADADQNRDRMERQLDELLEEKQVLSRISFRLEALPHGEVDAALPFAAILLDRPPGEVQTICRALRLSNRQIDTIVYLARSIPIIRNIDHLELADVKELMADPAWPMLLDLSRATDTTVDPLAAVFQRVVERTSKIRPQNVAPPPLVTGAELAAMGIPPGPRMGEILHCVYRAQLNEELHTKEEALGMAEQLHRE